MDLQGMSPTALMTNSMPEDCVSCGGRFFKQTFMFRRVSKILVGAPQDQLIPIPVFRCDDCGTPIGDMIPEGIDTSSEPNKLFDSGEN